MRFLPARVVSGKPKPMGFTPIEVIIPGGRVVRIAGDFDPSALRKLLGVLEART